MSSPGWDNYVDVSDQSGQTVRKYLGFQGPIAALPTDQAQIVAVNGVIGGGYFCQAQMLAPVLSGTVEPASALISDGQAAQQAFLNRRKFLLNHRAVAPTPDLVLSGQLNIPPGQYNVPNPVIESDSIILVGDSLQFFRFYFPNGLDIRNSRIFVQGGLKPENVFLFSRGTARIEASIVQGSVLSDGQINLEYSSRTFSLLSGSQLHGENAIFGSGEGNEILSNALCKKAAQELNLLCNPLFTTRSTNLVSGYNEVDKLSMWYGSMGTPDVFSSSLFGNYSLSNHNLWSPGRNLSPMTNPGHLVGIGCSGPSGNEEISQTVEEASSSTGRKVFFSVISVRTASGTRVVNRSIRSKVLSQNNALAENTEWPDQSNGLNNSSNWVDLQQFHALEGSENLRKFSITYLNPGGPVVPILNFGDLTSASMDPQRQSYVYVRSTSLVRVPSEILPLCKKIGPGESIQLSFDAGIPGFAGRMAYFDNLNAVWTWYEGATLIGNGKTITVSPGTTAIYTLKITVGNATVVVRDDIKVEVLMPTIQILGPNPVCEGAALNLTATFGPGVEGFFGTWSHPLFGQFGNGNSLNIGAVTLNHAGIYTLESMVRLCNGMYSPIQSQFLVAVLPRPQSVAFQPISLCRQRMDCGVALPLPHNSGTWSGQGVGTANPNCTPGFVFNQASADDLSDEGLPAGNYSLIYQYPGINGCLSAPSVLQANIYESEPLEIQVSAAPFCPGKTLHFEVPNPQSGWEYFWELESIGNFFGVTSLEQAWSEAGTYRVKVTGRNPADPLSCNRVGSMQVEINELLVEIGQKGVVQPEIEICAGVKKVPLELFVAPGTTGITWTDITDPFNPVLLNPDPDDPRFLLFVMPEPALDEQVVRLIEVIVEDYLGCKARGQIKLIKNPNLFTSAPDFSYLNPLTGNLDENPIELKFCSGNGFLFSPTGVEYTGSSEIGYFWSGTGISGEIQGDLSFDQLKPGLYEFSLIARALDGSPCGSQPRLVRVLIEDSHPLEIQPVLDPAYPNDFDLVAVYQKEMLQEYKIYYENDLIEAGMLYDETYPLNIYDPFPGASACRQDGVYKMILEYSDGCKVASTFTLLGQQRFMDPTTGSNSGNQTYSGKVYLHHDLLWTSGKLSFQDAEVFVRGLVQNVQESESALILGASPGFVRGTYLTLSGSSSSLLVKSTSFSSVNKRIWGGIRLQNINRVVFVETGSENQSRIEDAQVGLDVEMTLGNQGALIEGIHFKNCYTGLINRKVSNGSAASLHRIRNCSLDSDPREMKIPYHKRGEDPRAWFITHTGMEILGNSSFPVSKVATEFSQFANNKFSNAIFGVRVYLDGVSANQEMGFVNCTFDNLFRTGIDVSKGKTRIKGCKFNLPNQVPPYYDLTSGLQIAGSFKRVEGIVNRDKMTVEHSIFGPAGEEAKSDVFRAGIQGSFVQEQTARLHVVGNHFQDLSVAINLQNQESGSTLPLDFRLNCNRFDNSPQPSRNALIRKGLVIGEGVNLQTYDGAIVYSQQIGGATSTELENRAYPGANVWPVKPGFDRSFRHENEFGEAELHSSEQGIGWPNSPGWIAIENQNSTTVKYYRYNNEFVGWGASLQGPVTFFYPSPNSLKVATKGDGVPLGTQGYDFACENFSDPEVHLFPARISVVLADEDILGSAKNGISVPIPNPSVGASTIDLQISKESKSAVVQIVNLVGGEVLQNILIEERGRLKLHLDGSKSPSGVFIVRLLVDGIPQGTQKWVVKH
jgi:hypothetical protein